MKSNEKLAEEFKALMGRDLHSKGLSVESLRPWRVEMWNKFKEIEDRLCPVQADMKKKARGEQL